MGAVEATWKLAQDFLALEPREIKGRIEALEATTKTRFDAAEETNKARFELVGERARANFKTLNTRIRALEELTRVRFEALEESTRTRFEAMEESTRARFEVLGEQARRHFGILDSRIGVLEETTKWCFDAQDRTMASNHTAVMQALSGLTNYAALAERLNKLETEHAQQAH